MKKKKTYKRCGYPCATATGHNGVKGVKCGDIQPSAGDHRTFTKSLLHTEREYVVNIQLSCYSLVRTEKL